MTLMSTMYRDIEEEEQSPTDTSEDSIEVQVKPIKSAMAGNTNGGKKNKRKSQEPKRLATSEVNSDMKRCRLNSTGSEERSPPVSYSRSPSPTSPTSKSSSSSSPVSTKRTSLSPMCLAPKKRFKLDALRELEQMNSEVKPEKSETEKEANKSPFRPWSREGSVGESSKSSPAASAQSGGVPYIPFLLPGLRHPPILPLYPYLPPYLALPPKSDVSPSSLSPSSPASSPPPPQDEPLSLVMKDKRKENNNSKLADNNNTASVSGKEGDKTKSSPIKASSGPARPPVFNVEASLALMNAQKVLSSTNILQSPGRHRNITGSPASSLPTTPTRVRNDSGSTSSSGGEADKAKQRNYKNMTRERRVEANARERQRVHTITAAFDTLQAAIPTEEKDIKLSKLSVIKIATAYIMALSRMAGHDYTEDQSAPPVDEVVQHCSEVIEKECRIKKRNGSQ